MLFYSKFLVIIAPIRLMTLNTQLTLMPILVGIQFIVSEIMIAFGLVNSTSPTGSFYVGMHDRASEKYKMVCKTGLSEAKLPEIV